jgi:hypothetical protein
MLSPASNVPDAEEAELNFPLKKNEDPDPRELTVNAPRLINDGGVMMRVCVTVQPGN